MTMWFRDTWIDAADVDKADIREGVRDYLAQYLTKSEVQAQDTGEVRNAHIDGHSFIYDPTDTVTADNGKSVIVSNDGDRYKAAGWYRDSASAIATLKSAAIRAASGLPFNVIGESGELAHIAASGYAVGPVFHGFRANGTEASPTQALAGNMGMGIGTRFYHSGAAFATSSNSAIHCIAAEDQTGSAQGAFMRFLVTPIGSAVAARLTPFVLTHDGTIWRKDANVNWSEVLAAHTRPWADAHILASGADANTSISVNAYGFNAGFRGGRAQGAPNAATQTISGTYLTFMGGHGYDSNGWSAGTYALLGFMATENWTPTAHGTAMTFEVTPAGSVTRAEHGRWTSVGLGVGGVAAEKLHVFGRLLAQDDDGTAGAAQQFYIRGASDTNKQFLIGFNTTSDYGTLQPIHQGVGYKNLVLCGLGGFVRIGSAVAPVCMLDVEGPVRVKSYTVGTVPAANAGAGQLIYVSDETGGAVIAFSDGTNWKRVTDRATIA